MRDNENDEGWRAAYESCVSAAGSILMSAVSHPSLLEQSRPAELVDVVIEATSALVRWMASNEPFVSAAGMRTRDRQPGREAAAQGLVALFGGMSKADAVVMQLLASTNAPQPTQLVDRKTGTLLESLSEVVVRSTVAAQEIDRYVLAWALEIQ